MMKADNGTQAALSDDDKDLYTSYYTSCANVWKVLIEENVIPPKEDTVNIKPRDIVLSIINPNYRDANDEIPEVKEGTRGFYRIFINLWGSLPKETRDKIIQAYRGDENNFDLGTIKTATGKQLDLNVIVKMMKVDKGKKGAALSDDDKDLYTYYTTCANVWKVLIEEKLI